MNCFQIMCALVSISLPLFGSIDESVLPLIDVIYIQDFGKKVNEKQRESMHHATENQDRKLRVMTYNMLYNVKDAEDKLSPKHRWNFRKPRLQEYLAFAKADIIGSQELQEDQVQEVISFLGSSYSCYGKKTRGNEGRNDVNAIFFKNDRIELVEAKTIPYNDDRYENGFTCCYFRDKLQDQEFVVVNTKLTWGDVERRLIEATQLNQFSNQLPSELPVIIMGDFNTFPFIHHERNIFFDGDYIERILVGTNLKDAKIKSIFGHFGPICSITNSKETLEPFVGPQLSGFILDHILVNERVEVFTHGIDTARIDGEFPSDHFPVVADLFFR